MTNAEDMQVELPVNEGEGGSPSPAGQPEPRADAQSEEDSKVDRAWHNKRLEKEGKKRAKAVAEAKELRAQLAELQRKEAERAASQVDDIELELPDGFEDLSAPMQKAMKSMLQKARYDDSGIREALSEIKSMISSEKTQSAFRGLTQEQLDVIDEVRSETNLSDPKKLMALARVEEPELFNGVHASSGGHYVNSGGRGSRGSGGGMSSAKKEIADLERKIAENPKLGPTLGPKLLALQRDLARSGG